jgi:flagellar biosynthesis anti-sigma factor FlgM
VEIRNNLNSLNSLQELTKVAPTLTQAQSGAAAAKKESLSDRATLSSAAGVMAQAAASGDVRTEKAAEIQAALLAGSYHVEPAEVATKVVDSMIVKVQ